MSSLVRTRPMMLLITVVVVLMLGGLANAQLIVPVSRKVGASAGTPAANGDPGQTVNAPEVSAGSNYGSFSNSAHAQTGTSGPTSNSQFSSSLAADGTMEFQSSLSVSGYPISGLVTWAAAGAAIVLDLPQDTLFKQDVTSYRSGVGFTPSVAYTFFEATLGNQHVPFATTWDSQTVTDFFTLPAGHYNISISATVTGAPSFGGGGEFIATLTPVPEPTSVGLLSLAGIAMLARRSRVR